MKRNLLSAFLIALIFSACNTGKKDLPDTSQLPNIVYILADDLGYGDVSFYNPNSKIRTPNIDRLATEGMRFTDAHSPSSVCTPTRYGILTGRYCWRSRLPLGVLNGYGRALIDKDQPTVATMLKSKGYNTGVVGKWHLGLDWVLKQEHQNVIEEGLVVINEYGMVKNMKSEYVDFTKKPTDGPLDHGFDYSFILPASLDMEPYCYLENDRLTELPTEITPGNDLNTGATGAFWRSGRISPGFDFYEVLPTFIGKAINFIEAQKSNVTPFFLYLPLAAPHTPWVPKDSYTGKSGAGSYGDFVQMVDDHVGMVLNKLDQLGMAENTLVIFTSDNGPYWRPDMIERYDHRAAHYLKGMKADIWEGGHRIPFITRWPGNIPAGSTSDATTTLTNLMATCADLINAEANEKIGEDSKSILSILLGDENDAVVSDAVVHHSSRGFFSIRKGKWKLIEGRGSGGFSEPRLYEPKPGEPEGQLYDMEVDISEQENLYDEYPDVVEDLKKQLSIIRTGH
jgi:arylsulfatase A-like enzyme